MAPAWTLQARALKALLVATLILRPLIDAHLSSLSPPPPPPLSLGKTLQSIALLWTLLRQGFEGPSGRPLVQRALIVTPTSLVSNWASELTKWLGGRVRAAALCEASRAEALVAIKQFLAPRGHADVRGGGGRGRGKGKGRGKERGRGEGIGRGGGRGREREGSR